MFGILAEMFISPLLSSKSIVESNDFNDLSFNLASSDSIIVCSVTTSDAVAVEKSKENVLIFSIISKFAVEFGSA